LDNTLLVTKRDCQSIIWLELYLAKARAINWAEKIVLKSKTNIPCKLNYYPQIFFGVVKNLYLDLIFVVESFLKANFGLQGREAMV
jgi:hypothetical protein